jgi:hypothetical protein
LAQGVSIDIRRNSVGEIQGVNNGPNGFSEQSIEHATLTALPLKIKYSIIRTGYQQQSRRHLFMM